MSIRSDEYRLVRSNRKTISIEVTRELEVVVRAPRWAALRDIRYFVDEKEGWIKKNLKRMEAELAKSGEDTIEPLTRKELQKLANDAAEYIPDRVRYYAELIGVSYGAITIRNQKTRWGSCSSKGNLNFNCMLMLTPPEVIDAIVVHELCHRKEMNHSKRFYQEIYRVYPEYDRWNKWLSENGGAILRRNPNR